MSETAGGKNRHFERRSCPAAAAAAAVISDNSAAREAVQWRRRRRGARRAFIRRIKHTASSVTNTVDKTKDKLSLEIPSARKLCAYEHAPTRRSPLFSSLDHKFGILQEKKNWPSVAQSSGAV